MGDRSAGDRFLELTQHLAAGFAIDGTIHTANDALATLAGTDPVGRTVRGCDLGQGFLFARPAPVEAFGDVVASPA